MQAILATELKAHLEAQKPVTLIDLQDDQGFTHRHIPSATHLVVQVGDEAEVGNVLKDKDAFIVIYGEFDELGKGSAAEAVLQSLGYTNVHRLQGGLMGWMEAGYAVEGGASS
ncbi:rhodanese-like domain-containing protein [Patescibacteria group bacterium]|nr:rhodanese-like domain-containing protein [Patescibacteria group bacterium]